MKDAVLTIRLPLATRQRIEALAHREGRSLSQQAERLLERGLETPETGPRQAAPRRRGIRPLAGTLAGGHVPSLDECRQIRTLLSRALARRDMAHAHGRH